MGAEISGFYVFLQHSNKNIFNSIPCSGGYLNVFGRLQTGHFLLEK